MILNRQRTVRVARPPLELFLRQVRERLGLGSAEFTVCLVSDAEIARMNESFRKKKGPTDVLSFPAVARRKPVPLPKRNGPATVAVAQGERAVYGTATPSVLEGFAAMGASRYLGDIAISPATARRNARKFRRTLPSELQLLILHGVLHLLGYDHETDRGQMIRIEQRLRRRLGLS
jgi:probable rRNA maturation factor